VSKLLSRHPHVFSDGTFGSFGKSSGASVESIKHTWESKKAEERATRRVSLIYLMTFRISFPALTRAQKIQKRALRVGFDWPTIDGVFEKINPRSLDELAARFD
jgi:ATP diphosphatase